MADKLLNKIQSRKVKKLKSVQIITQMFGNEHRFLSGPDYNNILILQILHARIDLIPLQEEKLHVIPLPY